MNSSGDRVALYKKLTCHNLAEINQQILGYIKTLEFESNVFWNTVSTADFIRNTSLLAEWLIHNHIPVMSIAVTQGTHVDCCGPHTDTPPSRVKLSWPVLNTEHTWNRWYQPLPSARKQVNHLGGISYLDHDSLIEIDRMRVDGPALIATDVPHDVWFEPNAQFPRLGLQCQLFKEPEGL